LGANVPVAEPIAIVEDDENVLSEPVEIRDFLPDPDDV
jgi:hypothetical protein